MERTYKLLDSKGKWLYTVRAICDQYGIYKWALIAVSNRYPKNRWIKLDTKRHRLEEFVN